MGREWDLTQKLKMGNLVSAQSRVEVYLSCHVDLSLFTRNTQVPITVPMELLFGPGEIALSVLNIKILLCQNFSKRGSISATFTGDVTSSSWNPKVIKILECPEGSTDLIGIQINSIMIAWTDY